MHSFEVHSNESACRKSGRLGLEQVYSGFLTQEIHHDKDVLHWCNHLCIAGYNSCPKESFTINPVINTRGYPHRSAKNGIRNIQQGHHQGKTSEGATWIATAATTNQGTDSKHSKNIWPWKISEGAYNISIPIVVTTGMNESYQINI